MEKDFFDNLFKGIISEQSRKTICENCNTSLDYVLHLGRLGCFKCYDIFLPTLKKLVGQMNLYHVGKRPKNNKIEVMEELIIMAALEGKFEEAAKLKNAIKEL